MEVNQDSQCQGTPPSTPFEDGFTLSMTRGHTTLGPTESVRTDNYFTPLYTETQETDHTNVNANQQPLTHGDIGPANLVAIEAAAIANADDTEAEAASVDAADFIARLAAEAKAAEVAEAATAEAEANAAARLAAEEASAIEAADKAKKEAEAA